MPIKCSYCGKFIAEKALDMALEFTPDTYFTAEKAEFVCLSCRRPTPDSANEFLCSRCGINPTYKNGICRDCLDD